MLSAIMQFLIKYKEVRVAKGFWWVQHGIDIYPSFFLSPNPTDIKSKKIRIFSSKWTRID